MRTHHDPTVTLFMFSCELTWPMPPPASPQPGGWVVVIDAPNTVPEDLPIASRCTVVEMNNSKNRAAHRRSAQWQCPSGGSAVALEEFRRERFGMPQRHKAGIGGVKPIHLWRLRRSSMHQSVSTSRPMLGYPSDLIGELTRIDGAQYGLNRCRRDTAPGDEAISRNRGDAIAEQKVHLCACLSRICCEQVRTPKPVHAHCPICSETAPRIMH